MGRRRRVRELLIGSVCLVVLCGSRSNCDTRPATLTCTSPSINLNPGQCAPLSNPCGADWVSLDGFTLCNEPVGLSIRTVRDRGTVTRQICAASNIAPLFNAPVGFLYSQNDDFGEGSLNITVGVTPISAIASASPATINAGGMSQLDVAVSGGVPPYAFAWTPASSLSNASIQNPMAAPVATTTYQVTVTDSAGQTTTSSVDVIVSAGLTVTANPSVINVGFSSQLNVVVASGTPPFTYQWQPAATVSNATIPNPIAFPAQTTTYTVTVTDGNNVQMTGSVTVTVNLRVFASANPSVVQPGGTSQLVANAAGGIPPYSYAWTDPDGSLSATNISNPIASPAQTTTYTVTVTDSTGASVSRPVTVTVNGLTLQACFTTNPANPVVGQAFTVDMSCSSGAITNFTLWLHYTPGAFPTYSGSLPTYTTIQELPGTLNTRIQVTDTAGNTAILDQPIVVQ